MSAGKGNMEFQIVLAHLWVLEVLKSFRLVALGALQRTVCVWRTTTPHQLIGRRTGPSRFPSRALDTAWYGTCTTHREAPPCRRRLLLPRILVAMELAGVSSHSTNAATRARAGRRGARSRAKRPWRRFVPTRKSRRGGAPGLGGVR
jgi:hypothetical protein